MEFTEAPSIELVSRRLQYPLIKWLTKAKFEEMLQRQDTHDAIQPCIADADRANSRIYVGKSVQTHTGEGISYSSYQYYNYTGGSSRINLEIIGSVIRDDMTGQWELHVSHGSSEVVIKKEFWVLCIDDSRVFEWVPTQKVSLITPKFDIIKEKFKPFI